MNSVGISRELAPDPRGIRERAECLAQEIHVRPPVAISPALQLCRAVAQLPMPLALPVRSGRGRHEYGDHFDRAQREPQGKAPRHDDRAGRSRRARAAMDAERDNGREPYRARLFRRPSARNSVAAAAVRHVQSRRPPRPPRQRLALQAAEDGVDGAARQPGRVDDVETVTKPAGQRVQNERCWIREVHYVSTYVGIILHR